MIRTTLAAATALSIAALPAFASSTAPFEMSVEVNRTALETPAGAEQEFTRIRQDVHERCVAESETWRFSTSYAVRFCEKNTLKTTIATIDDANLTAAYQASIAK